METSSDSIPGGGGWELRVFRTIGGLFIAFVVLKIHAVFTGHFPSSSHDALLPMLNERQMMAVAVFIESVVAYLCLSNTITDKVRYLALFWLSSCLLFYRGASAIMYPGKVKRCSCLGVISLNADTELWNWLLLAFLLGLLAFSLRGLLRRYETISLQAKD